VQTRRTASDRELLNRFVDAGDEAAFTVLIERHGPVVLGVCRRSLRNLHDAEDACQATFLVLTRKAASVRKAASLGSWLHGVACRVALTLKRDLARRKRRDRDRQTPARRDPAAEVSWREAQTVLDEELELIPERYRAPLILCYLDGKTRDEAAQELEVSPGKLHGRLERGRALLRDRLEKRGITLAAALCATALSSGAAKAALPAPLLIASAKAASALAAGQPLTADIVTTNVLTLTQGVLKSMFLTKLKLGAAAALCVGLFVAIVGGVLPANAIAHEATAKDPGKTIVKTAAPAAKAESDEDFIRRVSKDLRGTEPTPAELHFFLTSKDPGKHQRIIDLFIQERQTKKTDVRAETVLALRALADANVESLRRVHTRKAVLALHDGRKALSVATLQRDFYKDVLVAKEKDAVANLTQSYLNRLQQYVKDHPKREDVPEAMLQIIFVYESQGKMVEAGAWREKLRKEYPGSAAAKAAK